MLGLRQEDKKHQTCLRILELVRAGRIKNLAICGSAFVELGVGLRGSLKKRDIIEALRLLRALTVSIPEVPLSSLVLMNGLELEQRLEKPNLFDCLHAATALNHDAAVVSDDPFYEQVPTLKRLSLERFASENQ